MGNSNMIKIIHLHELKCVGNQTVLARFINA